MQNTPALWRVTFAAAPDIAETLAELLGADAVAQSIACPPRQNTAEVELLFGAEPNAAAWHSRMLVLADVMGFPPPLIAITPVPKLDWLRKVHEDFPPLPIARWTIHGAAHRDKVPTRRHALQIDATSAFGTGEHPTTKGCLMMLDRLLKTSVGKRRGRMLDIGCGSGILALAYAQATKNQAVAVDLDLDSVAIAQFNARANGLRNHLRIGWSSGYRAKMIKRAAPYDLIMSNIFAVP